MSLIDVRRLGPGDEAIARAMFAMMVAVFEEDAEGSPDGEPLRDDDVRSLLRREDFWDPAPGAGLLRGQLFRRRLEGVLAAKTFEECRVPASPRVAPRTYD